jgi:hypothetical protein
MTLCVSVAYRLQVCSFSETPQGYERKTSPAEVRPLARSQDIRGSAQLATSGDQVHNAARLISVAGKLITYSSGWTEKDKTLLQVIRFFFLPVGPNILGFPPQQQRKEFDSRAYLLLISVRASQVPRE